MTLEEYRQKLCLSCMECCKTMIVPTTFSIFTDPDIELLFKMRNIRYEMTSQGPYLIVPSRCEHLSLRTGCKIYDKRPQVCKDYDGTKVSLMKDVCRWFEVKEYKCGHCGNIVYSISDEGERCDKCSALIR